MKKLLVCAYTTVRHAKVSRWKRNTHDPDLRINCIRSMMIGAFNIIDGCTVILTLGYYKPDFATRFLLETLKPPQP